MSIRPEDLKRITKNFLKVLERSETLGLLDSEQASDRTFPIEGNPDEYISVGFKLSSDHTQAYTKSPTLSYNVVGGGIPLEVRINNFEGYSRIIVKTTSRVPSYKPFAVDIFQNIAQDKKINSTDISEVKREVEKLLE